MIWYAEENFPERKPLNRTARAVWRWAKRRGLFVVKRMIERQSAVCEARQGRVKPRRLC